VLTVYNPGTGDQTVVPLAANGWTVSGSIAKEKYRYRSVKGASTSAKVTVGNGRLTVKVSGVGSFALTNAPEGTLAVRLRLGTGIEYCAVAPAKAPAATDDTTTKFVAVSNAAAPASCPAVP
jgi:hypothetical protein